MLNIRPRSCQCPRELPRLSSSTASGWTTKRLNRRRPTTTTTMVVVVPPPPPPHPPPIPSTLLYLSMSCRLGLPPPDQCPGEEEARDGPWPWTRMRLPWWHGRRRGCSGAAAESRRLRRYPLAKACTAPHPGLLILSLPPRLVGTHHPLLRWWRYRLPSSLWRPCAKPMHYLCSRCKGCLIFMGV
jgi:hypothetical protein